MTLISVSNSAIMEDEVASERQSVTGDKKENDTKLKTTTDDDVEQDEVELGVLAPGLGPGEGSSSLPTLTVQAATPLPNPQTPDINNNHNEDNNNNLLKSPRADVVKEEDEEDAEDMSDEDVEEEDVEEEEEEPEMTAEEKKDMHECVKSGDIDSLEDCLDLPGADINMTWFRENLLMTALRYNQKEMAEFLLDNGVDHTYSTSIVGMRETSKGKVLERYQLTCRQMAYDKEMFDIVDLIDSLQGQLFPFIRLPERTPRFRRPRPPTPSESQSGSDDSSEGADVSSEGEIVEGEKDKRSQHQHKKKKRKKKVGQSGCVDGKTVEKELVGNGEEEDDEGDGEERNETFGAGSGIDVDSGHHSLASSKLKMAMLREHDRLMEKEEKEEDERERKERSMEGSSSQRQRLRKARSSASSGAKEKAGSVNSRLQNPDKSETLREEDGCGEEEKDGTRDEGYEGSASLHSGMPVQQPHQILSPDPVRPWEAAPTNRIRATKSALTMRKSLHQRFGRRILSGNSLALRPSESGYSSSLPLNFEEASENDISNTPLHWKKVSTFGSYARESKQWHQAKRSHNQDTSATSVEISEISLSSSPNQSASTSTRGLVTKLSAANHSKSFAKSRSAGATSTSASSSGFGRLSTSSSSSMSAPTTATDINPSDASSSTSHLKKPSPNPVAGYMRATRSTAIKCRLTPRFAKSYVALNFQDYAGSRSSSRGAIGSTSQAKVSSQSPESVTLSLSKLSAQMVVSDAPLAPRVATKKHTIPVLASAINDHQKRNQSAISFRS